MQPNEKPGKMYGSPKVHKGIPEGQSIPPCRPIISNSGAQTEMISAFVDYHSKHEVKKLPSYVEDSPDILRIFETENEHWMNVIIHEHQIYQSLCLPPILKDT